MAVSEAIMPRVESKLDEHVVKTEAARSFTNEKLDTVLGKLDSVEKQAKEIEKLNSIVSGHHDLFQQGKGAWRAASAIGAVIGALVAGALALLAKVAGFIRIA
jgi:hypothetical protein